MTKTTQQIACDSHVWAYIRYRYEIDWAWRKSWHHLAYKPTPGRLQAVEEYICRRARTADRRINWLMTIADSLSPEQIGSV